MSESESFYSPTSDMFGNEDAWQMFTNYAAALVDAGLERSFPSDAVVRNIAIELLAERCAVDEVADDPRLIADSIVEAVEIRHARRSS